VAGVLLFVLAVLLARLALAGGEAWIILAVALPVVCFVLATRIRLLPALAVTALFAGAVLAFRYFLLGFDYALPALLVLPAVALAWLVAGKVVRSMMGNAADGGSAKHNGQNGVDAAPGEGNVGKEVEKE
jgi:hypothetical protein